MASRTIEFTTDEYYHIYNRGTDKRNIVQDEDDANRFLEGLRLFNTVDPLGGFYEHSLAREVNDIKNHQPLVEVVTHCLNPNHFHLLLKQCIDNGISEYLQRVGTACAKHFNHKYKRTGALFEGKFKAKHIADNDYLLHTSAYINLNDRVHRISGQQKLLVRNSWPEYTEGKNGICKKELILEQFKNGKEYERFALESLELMLESKRDQAELKAIEFES